MKVYNLYIFLLSFVSFISVIVFLDALSSLPAKRLGSPAKELGSPLSSPAKIPDSPLSPAKRPVSPLPAPAKRVERVDGAVPPRDEPPSIQIKRLHPGFYFYKKIPGNYYFFNRANVPSVLTAQDKSLYSKTTEEKAYRAAIKTDKVKTKYIPYSKPKLRDMYSDDDDTEVPKYRYRTHLDVTFLGNTASTDNVFTLNYRRFDGKKCALFDIQSPTSVSNTVREPPLFLFSTIAKRYRISYVFEAIPLSAGSYTIPFLFYIAVRGIENNYLTKPLKEELYLGISQGTGKNRLNISPHPYQWVIMPSTTDVYYSRTMNWNNTYVINRGLGTKPKVQEGSISAGQARTKVTTGKSLNQKTKSVDGAVGAARGNTPGGSPADSPAGKVADNALAGNVGNTPGGNPADNPAGKVADNALAGNVGNTPGGSLADTPAGKVANTPGRSAGNRRLF